MEGDVIGLPVLLGAMATVLGGVWTLLTWFARRMLADIDARLARIDDVAREVGRVDADLKTLIAEMPLHYQRREDAIREYTAINAKLDRLYEAMLEIKRND